ncbi:suppressor protein SRP40-like [Chrysoperla carnea]|uniref:suppressor protein SRP40-like n=1 Tax=Chrysoperla carnea TaxID=189513 RepID=UPI001D0778A8|nr:suppressor protein SRP40-like [Chrysoperla carnea]
MDHHQNSSGLLLVTMQQESSNSGSANSPFLTPSPSREIRGLRLFRAISRKLGKRSQEDLSSSYTGEDDSRSSSTDSCSSTSTGRCSRKNNKNTSNHHLSSQQSSLDNYNISPNHLSTSSSSGSDTGSDSQESKSIRHRHHHSTTAAVSFRRVFQHLSLHNSHRQRSLSCENTKDIHFCDSNDSNNTSSNTKRSSKKNQVPKRILRPPITYTYIRGMSGLPTQRVPRSTHRYPHSNRTSSSDCYCNQYSTNITSRY